MSGGTILVASDLSARSDRAVERALGLARAGGQKLIVLHVIDEDLPSAIHEKVRQAASDDIEAHLRKFGSEPGDDVRIEIVAGRDYRDILEQAAAVSAEMIVLGVHRNESGLMPFSGTTVERVLRQSRQPVLVVRDRAGAAYRKVMIAVDFSAFSRFAIRAATAIAPGGEFHAVHAYKVPFEGFLYGRDSHNTVREDHERELAGMIDEEMASMIAASTENGGSAPDIRPVLRHGEVEETLRSEVERLSPDLLVLGTHGRVGVAHAVLGSIAESFLSRPPCDVLAVKAW